MNLRRYTPEQIFEIIENSNLFDKNNKHKSNFIFIPRYNVGIKLTAKSISFFFNYIYKVRTLKTRIIWISLIVISYFKFFKTALKLMKIPFEIHSPNINLSLKEIDVLYAEWHFIGVYSEKNNINIVPRLISNNISENGYWHEEIAVDKNKQFISDSDFALAQKKQKSNFY